MVFYHAPHSRSSAMRVLLEELHAPYADYVQRVSDRAAFRKVVDEDARLAEGQKLGTALSQE